MSFRTLLFVFLAAGVCFRVDAIKCYNCDTEKDSKCNDAKAEGDKFTVECSSDTSIRKTFKQLFAENATLPKADGEFLCYAAKVDGEEQTGIIRGCATRGSTICNFFEANAQKVHYCRMCNTELCNSAEGLRVALFTSIVCLFAAFLGFKLH